MTPMFEGLPKVIDSFNDEFKFLSNFYLHEVEFEGIIYDSTEHAYQAAKDVRRSIRVKIKNAATPGKAKRLGSPTGIVTLRPNWENIKIPIMKQLLLEKFKDAELKSKLKATGSAKLVEGNTWGDQYWGVCNGKGKNMLGILLMEVRSEI